MSTQTITGTTQVGYNTKNLEKFGRNITKEALEGKISPAYGRDSEVRMLSQVLNRKNKPNGILVGPFGVGKTAIVEGLALSITNNTAPKSLLDKQIIEISQAKLLAGAQMRGQFEQRLTNVIEEAEANPNVILFFDEIHTLMGLGGTTGSMDGANMLKPALARGSIRVIGATTTGEYTEIEKDGAFKRRFMRIAVDEPSLALTREILKLSKISYEKYHNIIVSDEIIDLMTSLSRRYITDKYSPDKDFDILDICGAKIKNDNVIVEPPDIRALREKIKENSIKKFVAHQDQEYEIMAELVAEINRDNILLEGLIKSSQKAVEPTVVSKDLVYQVIEDLTHIKLDQISKSDGDKVAHLKSNVLNTVIGQNDAAEVICDSITRSFVIPRGSRPLYFGLCIGSTGIGKTHMAKAIANELFPGEQNNIIKIDMSEYSESHTVSKLIGSPAGYVGYGDTSNIFEQVRTKSGRCVILLDEIEKAHPRVLNLFLQISDDGYLTDSKGTQINFSNSIILMTSNVGVRKLKDFGKGIGYNKSFDISEKEAILVGELKKFMAPEVINRFDDVVYFKPLDEDSISKIVHLTLGTLKNKLSHMTTPTTITFSDELVAYLGKEGYSEEYGARNLNRLVSKLIEVPLSKYIIENDGYGAEIKAELNDNKITFTK
jgi:ATP-dependent Clp protease ATP-binding subunit ClpC